MLLAVGLGLYWFVEYQDAGGAPDASMWAYLIMVGARLLADFVAAWFALSALQLAVALGRFALVYVRSLWLEQSR